MVGQIVRAESEEVGGWAPIEPEMVETSNYAEKNSKPTIMHYHPIKYRLHAPQNHLQSMRAISALAGL